MISLAYASLWIFVFSVACEFVVSTTGTVAISKMTGMLAAGLTLLAVLTSGRMRRWHAFHVAALLFLIWAGCGLLALHGQAIPKKFWTFAQLTLVLLMVWELAPSRSRVLGLMAAYVLGAYVAAVDTILVYRRASEVARRFAAGTFDANDLAMILALALPMAWYLGMTYQRPLARWVFRAFLPIGLFAIGLTGSRGGMLATMVALLVVPLTMVRLSPARLATTIAMLALAGILAVAYVPQTTIQRLATTKSEVEGGRVGGRFKLWVAGMRAFVRKPVMGYGPATFKSAITPDLGPMAQVAHNSFISVLVEEGIGGFLLYSTMLVSVFLSILSLPRLERRFGLVLFATLIVAMLPLTWEDRRAVWFILAALLGVAKSQVPVSDESAWHPDPRRGIPGKSRLRAARRLEPLTLPDRNAGA